MLKGKLYFWVEMSEKRAKVNIDPLKSTILRKQNIIFFLFHCSTKDRKCNRRLYLHIEVVENLHWKLMEGVYYGLILIMKLLMNLDLTVWIRNRVENRTLSEIRTSTWYFQCVWHLSLHHWKPPLLQMFLFSRLKLHLLLLVLFGWFFPPFLCIVKGRGWKEKDAIKI